MINIKQSVILLLIFLFLWLEYNNTYSNNINSDNSNIDIIKLAPPSLRLYYRTLYYSEKYDIPTYISFGVLRKESSYQHPLDFKYTPAQISSGYAYGSYQILLSTARYWWKDNTITKEDLLYDINLNTQIGLSYLKDKYDKYNNWEFALGRYNTGFKVKNSYAIDIYNNNL